MKFPQTGRSPVKDINARAVVKRAGQTFVRFPLAILLAILATVFCIRMVHVSNQDFDLASSCGCGAVMQ